MIAVLKEVVGKNAYFGKVKIGQQPLSHWLGFLVMQCPLGHDHAEDAAGRKMRQRPPEHLRGLRIGGYGLTLFGV